MKLSDMTDEQKAEKGITYQEVKRPDRIINIIEASKATLLAVDATDGKALVRWIKTIEGFNAQLQKEKAELGALIEGYRLNYKEKQS